MFHFKNALLLLGLTLSVGSFAESLPTTDGNLRIGANASFNQYAYHQDDKVTVMPQAFYDNNRVYIKGAEAGVYGYKDASNEWRMTVGYDSREFRPDDSTVANLKGLDERKWSVMVGSSYMKITPYGGFKIHAKTDALGRSDGTTVKLAHLSRFKLMDNQLTIYPELGVQWNNKDYNQYYYGISQQESARTGVTAYQADSSINPYASVSASYAFNPKWSGFVSQSLEYLSDEQKNSPMVDNRLDSKTIIGFNYHF